MEALTNSIQKRRIMSRRRAMHQMMLSAAALGIASCTPLRLVMDSGRETGPESLNTLRAFMETVVPGAPANPDLSCYTNEVFGFADYVHGFTDDLNRRADKFYKRPFESLEVSQREEIIKSGLESGRITSTLYTGAVFLTQIAVYTGMTNRYRGCPLIDFDGVFKNDRKAASGNEEYFGRSLTTDGNPN